ncbi:PepSY-associated TM helix domain-containing protein [Paenibacillus mucilaginosus]|nr:PepSY-associated TM helix domain-containing protein [Paenibacillus caseinilyticus]MCZ8523426.1 PepSY-associated TM helix domain-containing protein [Paenibacillus caseinilyticus]
MRKYRQLHLWIGLICSVFILIESVTGLVLAEPWLIGGESRSGGRPPQAAAAAAPAGASPAVAAVTAAAPAEGAGTGRGTQPAQQRGAEQGSSLMGIMHQLHEGRIGSTDLRWLVDVTAVAMIILTATGIMLSVQTLRAQSRSRKRRQGGQGPEAA